MRIPDKRELKQIASYNPSDIDFKDFWNLYKKFSKKTYSFFVIDPFLALDNHRKNLIERI